MWMEWELEMGVGRKTCEVQSLVKKKTVFGALPGPSIKVLGTLCPSVGLVSCLRICYPLRMSEPAGRAQTCFVHQDACSGVHAQQLPNQEPLSSHHSPCFPTPSRCFLALGTPHVPPHTHTPPVHRFLGPNPRESSRREPGPQGWKDSTAG